MNQRAIEICVGEIRQHPVRRVAVAERGKAAVIIQLGRIAAVWHGVDLKLTGGDRVISGFPRSIERVGFAAQQLRLADQLQRAGVIRCDIKADRLNEIAGHCAVLRVNHGSAAFFGAPMASLSVEVSFGELDKRGDARR